MSIMFLQSFCSHVFLISGGILLKHIFLKGQMQRNLNNIYFVLRPSENFVYIIINKNHFLKVGFVRTMALKTRKSDDFRALHENELEMAALGEETKLFVTTYLVSLNTRRKFSTLAPSSVYRPSVGENGWPRTLISTM